ncbi:MAG: carbonic anhydrase [Hyphomicrobiales bacterium]|nr:carbonic anhydrase [Hyphomicrobiales bacterium]
MLAYAHQPYRKTRFVGMLAAGITSLFVFSAGASDKDAALLTAKADHSAHGDAKHRGQNHHSGPPHWDYQGAAGPEHWGDLSPAYRVCGVGVQQSPIDLHDAIGAKISDVAIDYTSGPFEVVNNGHTIQVNVAPGSRIRLDGTSYKLLQFHFHHPSEHLINGKPFEMEAHFVHISDDGVLAVLGVMISPGAANTVLAPVWEIMPASEGKSTSSRSISPADLLPRDRSLYRYLGSLTTPPCSEKVIWTVFKQPIEASHAQLNQFSALFAMNARPVLPLNRRFILDSRHGTLSLGE